MAARSGEGTGRWAKVRAGLPSGVTGCPIDHQLLPADGDGRQVRRSPRTCNREKSRSTSTLKAVSVRAQQKRPDEQAARKPAAPAGGMPAGPMSPAAALSLQRAVGNRTLSRQLAGFAAGTEQAPSPGGQRTAMLPERSVVQRAGEEQAAQEQGRQDQAARDQATQEQAAQEQAHAENLDLEGLNPRERELSARYGIRIGPSRERNGPHFVGAMLDHIDAALRTLPMQDLGSNEYLLGIELDTGEAGSASAYRIESLTIGMVRPVFPWIGLRAPQRIWARMNRGIRWQRRLMDRGSMAGQQGIGPANDRALGIGSRDRHVMAGVSDILAHGNLIEWTIRHEAGHAADMSANWASEYAHEERFGGWRTYLDDPPQEVAEAALTRAELNTVNPARHNLAVWTLSSLLRAKFVRELRKDRMDAFLQRYKDHLDADEFSRRSEVFVKFVRMALAQPWTLDDGGAGTLNVNGRIYHLDHYNQWVSYSAGQRAHAVSNYQFSSPKEWFAEAYATYHDPKPGVRNRLRPDVQAWFAEREQQGGQTSG